MSFAEVAAASREEIQQSSLKALALATAAGAALAWWVLASGDPSVATLSWISIALTLLSLLCLPLADVSLRAGKVLFLCTWSGGAAVCLRLAIPGTELLFLVPALGAGALLKPWAAPLVGVASAVLIGTARPEQAFQLAGITVLVSTGIWLVLRPLHDLLERYSKQSLQAIALAEELRDQRGKLNRTIKDLDASYRLLQKTNRELATACHEADALRNLRHRFATNLSHELRTPLNIILGFSRLLYSNPELYGFPGWNDDLRRDLAEVHRNAGYLSGLVDDIVDLARIDGFAMPIHREMSSLPQVVNEAVDLIRSLARSKGIKVEMRLPEVLPPIPMDRIRIRQVLFNLLTNAVRHTDQGEVAVEARMDSKEVIVSVRDTGCGIPPDELETIFNEFHQVGRPKDTEDSGKGLGLAIAKRFVQLHGGSIWAESEVSRGSTFSFSLPLADKSVAFLKEGEPSPVPVSKGKPLVLVFNDDGSACGYLRRRIDGFEFVAAGESSEVKAREKLRDEQVSAIIVNRGPDTFSGGASEAANLATSLSLPVIECSLPSASWLPDHHSFTAVLTKPVHAENLVETLKSIVGGDCPPRVLIADDDRGFVHLIARMLEAQEWRCQLKTAYSGEEVLREVRSCPPDVVLLDLVMPGLNGFEVASQMRADPDMRHIPLVAVTAATPGEDHLHVQGATFGFARPYAFRPGELVALIASTLNLATERLALPQGSS